MQSISASNTLAILKRYSQMTSLQTSSVSAQLPLLRRDDGIKYPQFQPDVKKLQQVLGFPPNQIDGKFGQDTEDAVKRFQQQNGLLVDGIVGGNTWSALMQAPIKISPTSPPAPTIALGSQNINLDALIQSIPFPNVRVYARQSIPLILQECNANRVTDLRQVAYILATAEHESHLGEWMEEFASGWDYEGNSDLGNTHPGDGPKFKGRGFVQLTGRRNYTDWSNRLGINLVDHPETVMEPKIAAKILVQGMRDGTFTGLHLGDFIGQDFFNARKIINRLDRAPQIAAIAEEYLKVL